MFAIFTFNYRHSIECLYGSLRAKLGERDFEEENGESTQEKADEVRDEERAAPVTVAQVRESPNISKTYGIAYHPS